MRFPAKIPWRAALLATGLVLIVCAGLVVWQTTRAVRDSADRIASEAQLRFTSVRLDRALPSGVETISAPAVFRDVALFRERLWISGPAGLLEYDANGVVRARYRVGLELPPAPLVSLAVGVAADASEPELFVTTAGEGLLAFDGRGFRQIRPDEAPYRRLTAVLPLATGRVLLGTEKRGVLVYDGKSLTSFHPTLSDVHVTTLVGDEASLWVGTLDRGVLHWHAGQTDRFGEAEGLPDPQVLSVVVADGRAYVGTPLGVAEFRGGRFARALASGFFARTLLVRGEKLALGTLDEGTVEIPLSAQPGRSPRARGQASPGQVERLLEMEGKLYALGEDGLYAVDEHTGGWRSVLKREGTLLADRNISALAIDAAGKLWVGYFDRGLDIVEPGGGRATHIENEHVFCVNRIAHDPDRGLAAVATANGLVLFDPAGNQRQVLGRSEGLIADHVTDVALRPGAMTVATPAGLTFIDAEGMRSLYAFHGLVNNHAYALASSGDRLLVGTLGGLSVLESGVVRASYTTANSGLKHNWITAIVPVGEEWFVGTYGAGILRLDTSGTWQSFLDATAAFEVNPNAMVATESRVYAGTLGGGLYVYDRSSGRWATVTAGMPSSNVTALAAHGGYIYIGTDNGLVRFAEQSVAFP